MRTIRRLYFYAVAAVSLEVVLWGLIGLARSIFHSSNMVSSLTDKLAQSLALVLVGLPVFGYHWWKAQKDAAGDADEHASGVRAIFLHAVLLGTLIPIVQNLIALANRTLLETARMNSRMALFGGAQNWADNLVAILMNAIAAAYFIQVALRDWKTLEEKGNFILVRRLYRTIWLFYGLILVVAGMQQTLRFILDLIPGPFATLMRTQVVNGVTLLLVGTPIWFFAWRTLQESPGDPGERSSLLRLGVLYFLSLAGVLTVLSAAGLIIDTLLRLAFGQAYMSPQEVINRINGPISIGIPLGGVWAYHGTWLGRMMAEIADTTRRAGVRRVYFYVLALIGLVASFIGVSQVMLFVIDRFVLGTAQLGTITSGLALLICGLPLWLITWRQMQAESLSEGDLGDHARRSLLRRSYLYLVLFASVVGGMISAGGMFFQLLRALLGEPQANLAGQVLRLLSLVFLFTGLGIYHGVNLRRDGKLAQAVLSARHAAFPILLFNPGDDRFTAGMAAAIQKQAPRMPVTLQPAGIPVTKDVTYKAIVLPAGLALDPPVALQRWIKDYKGSKIAVPHAASNWILTGASMDEFTQAALALRSLAEGHEVKSRTGTSGWTIVVYIAAALFGLELLPVLISLGFSFFQN